MAREWIETDNEAEVMSATNGIEGKIIITTATADVLDIDGENSIKTLLLKNGYLYLLNAIEEGTAHCIFPNGDTVDVNYIPDKDEEILITNISKAA